MNESSINDTSQTEAPSGENHLTGWNGEPLVAVFFIALEQPMAVPDGTSLFATRLHEPVDWVKWNEGHNFVGIRLHRTPITDTYQMQLEDAAMDVFKQATNWQAPPNPRNLNFDPIPPPQTEILASVAEVATPLLLMEDLDTRHALSNAFDRCIEELRKVTRAYFAVSHDVRFRPISRQTCRPLIPYTTQELDGTWGQMGIFWSHEGVSVLPGGPDELTEQQFHALQVNLERARKGDPLTPFVERSRSAHRSFRIDGDYPTAIIAAYTACEVLLNAVLLLTAWEEGMRRNDTRGWFEGQGGFLSRVTGQVQPRLGGRWSSGASNDPLTQLRALSKIRNGIVHNGQLPEEANANRALETLGDIEDFVKQRLGAKRQIYPRSALSLLGSPGMERLGFWDKWMEHFVNEHAENEPDWIASFIDWRDHAGSPFVPSV